MFSHFGKCYFLLVSVEKMAILQQLSTDLALLVLEGKRRNPDVKESAEKAIATINSIQNENEAVNSLKTNTKVVEPFVLGLNSRNGKLILISLRCLSYLAISNCIPDSKIGEIIDSLYEATNTTADIQIKILQILPGFFQSYNKDITGDKLSTILNVCSTLQGANRQPAIAHTAQATFTQLLDTAFEKVRSEDQQGKEKLHEVVIDDDKTVKVADCAFDAYRLTSDLCILIEHHKPSFLKTNYISEDYGFEILETLIKNNNSLFLTHQELGFLLRTKVAPILLRFLSSSKDFSLMVRVSRLIFLLINETFQVLTAEAEVTLSLLTHLLSKNSGTSNWKRIMSLEIYSGLFKNSNLTKKMFIEYDNNQEEERKLIISDILNACLVILEDNKSILNTGELIQKPLTYNEVPPSSASSLTRKESQTSIRASLERQTGLSSKSANVSVSYLESIDKPDPPITPNTYHLLLIQNIVSSLIDCIMNFTNELTGDFESGAKFIKGEDLEGNKLLNYEFVTAMIDKTQNLILNILEIYLHSTLDNNLFTSLLKSLEDLCFCSGVLSLEESKINMLKIIASYTVKIEGKPNYQSKVYSISESIVDTISSKFGQAVSNIAQQQQQQQQKTPTKSPQFKFYTRNINSRQVYCFQSLINLAISLGENLNNDWEIIAMTLQWISYYVDGQSGSNNKDVPVFSPFLNNNDLQIIETTLENLNTGFKNSSNEMFISFTNSLIKISDTVLESGIDDQLGQNPIDENGNLQPCIFNKLYAVNKMSDIAIVDPINFLIKSNETCAVITNYFSLLAQKRQLDDELRLLACRNLDSVVKACANSGFSYKNDDLNLLTESCVLNSLYDFITGIANLPYSNELLVINCEVKMYLQNLDSLKSIIDKFGNLIKERWDVVTSMLNFPFIFITNYDQPILNESTITEIITLVIKSAFESLKVILDEVLQSIPKNQIKVIIDSLKNFVSQKFDLNISFNSVSYLWIINDYIKDSIDSSNKKEKLVKSVKTEEDLIEIVSNAENSENINDYSYYCYLWLYLVSSFVSTTFDERARVRDAAIITFFDIIETFSLENTSWELIYDVILKPDILDSDMKYDVSDKIVNKELMNSSKTLVSNITKLFVNKLSEVDKSNRITEYWSGLIGYFLKLINLPYDWIELENEVYNSYHKIITLFESKSISNKTLLISLFEFWDKLEINYNFDNQRHYLELLNSLVQCFEPSIQLFRKIMNLERFCKLQNVLIKCISYPVLDSEIDNFKCTKLQKAVLNNFELIQKDTSFIEFHEKQIDSLDSVITLPFSVDHANNSNVNIPTFIYASHLAMVLLLGHFDKTVKFDLLLNNGSLGAMFQSLLKVSKQKNDKFKFETSKYLWMQSVNVLVSTTCLFSDYLLELSPEKIKALNYEKLDEMISLILKTLDSCFSNFEGINNDLSIENFDLLEYQKLKRSVLVIFNKFDDTNGTYKIQSKQIESYISSIWNMSFLYKEDELLTSILPKNEHMTSSDMKLLITLVTNDEMCDNYGITASLGMSTKLKIAKSCLLDLSELVDPNNYPNLWEFGLPFLLSRYALALRKYVTDVQILGNRPTPKVQDIELDHIVTGLKSLLANLNKYPDYIAQVKVLYPMLIFCLTFGRRSKDWELGMVCKQLGSA